MIRLFGKRSKDTQEASESKPEGTGETDAARAAAPAVAASAPDSAEADVLARLRDILSQKGIAAAGRLNIIGLEKARERVGERWGRVAPKIHSVARETFEHYLRSGDLFTKFGDTGYVVMFQGLSPQEAEVKCLLVAREVGRRLFGEEDAAGVVTVRGVLVGAEGSVTIESANLAAAVGGLIDKEAARSRESEAGRQVSGGLLFSPPPQEVRARLPPDLSFVYRPFWDVRRKVLSTYACAAARRVPGRGMLIGYHVLEGEDLAALVPELDGRVLATATEQLAGLLKDSRKLLVTCPVHVATLGRGAAAAAYKKACQDIPEDQRRLLVFELWGLTPEIPRSRVTEIALTLKTVARSVIADVPLTFTHFERLQEAGLRAVGTSLEIGAGRRSEAAAMGLMEKFVAGANRVGLRTHAAGLATLSLATAAVATGFDYVGGDAIHAPVDSPQHVLRFEAADLFQRLFK